MSAPLTVDDALRRHPEAARLGVYDGRHLVGVIVDARRQAPRSPAAPSFAFRPDGTLVGRFASRREAARALPGAGR